MDNSEILKKIRAFSHQLENFLSEEDFDKRKSREENILKKIKNLFKSYSVASMVLNAKLPIEKSVKEAHLTAWMRPIYLFHSIEPFGKPKSGDFCLIEKIFKNPKIAVKFVKVTIDDFTDIVRDVNFADSVEKGDYAEISRIWDYAFRNMLFIANLMNYEKYRVLDTEKLFEKGN